MLYRSQRFILIFLLLCISSVSNTQAAPAAAEFGVLPTIYDIAISPDGKNLAMFMAYQGEHIIRIVAVDGEQKTPKLFQLSNGTKPKWIKWANNNRVLAGLWLSKKSGTTAYEVSDLFTIDATTMKGKFLVKTSLQAGQFKDDVIDFLERDPDHILMSFSDRDPNKPDIQRVHVATGKIDRLKRGSTGIQRWFTDNRGEPRLGQGRTDNMSVRWFMTIRDANKNEWRSANDYPGLEANDDVRGFTDNPAFR